MKTEGITPNAGFQLRRNSQDVALRFERKLDELQTNPVLIRGMNSIEKQEKIAKKLTGLLSGAWLVINFKDDVFDYILSGEDGRRFSEFYNSGRMERKRFELSQEFYDECVKQSDEIEKKIQFLDTKTVVLNYKGTDIIKFTPRNSTYWRNNGREWVLVYKFNSIESMDDCTDFSDRSSLYFQVLIYYLLNPYIELDPLPESRTDGKSAVEPVHTDPCPKIINLTANHHKYHLRHGVNVLDLSTGVLHPSIADAARKHNEEYNYFYYDLMHGKLPSMKRIEKLEMNLSERQEESDSNEPSVLIDAPEPLKSSSLTAVSERKVGSVLSRINKAIVSFVKGKYDLESIR
jgi:hypothetical protein